MSNNFFEGVDQAVETLDLRGAGLKLDELTRLSRELMSALDAEQAMVAVGEAVRQVCDAERFVVLLLDHGTLVAKAARDASGADLPLPAQVDQAACEFAHQSGGVAHSQSVRFKRDNLLGLVAVPMQAAHGCVGVIYADGLTRFHQTLDAHAEEMLTLLASQAAMALANHQLVEKVQEGQLETRLQFEHRLHEELQRATRYKRPFAVACIEVEGAEQLLARYDLTALDELVDVVARAVQKDCRGSDMMARLGPARLGLILPEPTDAQGETRGLKGWAERVRGRLAGAANVRGVPHKLGIVMGVVSYQQAPLLGLKGLMHEVELVMAVALREKADHFSTR